MTLPGGKTVLPVRLGFGEVLCEHLQCRLESRRSQGRSQVFPEGWGLGRCAAHTSDAGWEVGAPGGGSADLQVGIIINLTITLLIAKHGTAGWEDGAAGKVGVWGGALRAPPMPAGKPALRKVGVGEVCCAHLQCRLESRRSQGRSQVFREGWGLGRCAAHTSDAGWEVGAPKDAPRCFHNANLEVGAPRRCAAHTSDAGWKAGAPGRRSRRFKGWHRLGGW